MCILLFYNLKKLPYLYISLEVTRQHKLRVHILWAWQVRTVSAKALGAMVKGMGESCFDNLLPWLMETLASEQSSVDRSGAAQGENNKPFDHCNNSDFF